MLQIQHGQQGEDEPVMRIGVRRHFPEENSERADDHNTEVNHRPPLVEA
jgi:hypothetical protein